MPPVPPVPAVAAGFKARLIGFVASWIMRLFYLTVRVRVNDPAGILTKDPGPLIWCFWHNAIFIAPLVYRRYLRRHRRMVVLTSASRDGAMLAETMRQLGMQAVRGSSSRRGAQALVECRRAVREGNHLSITPDGPRGPCCQMAPGVLQLARVCGVPVVPLAIHCHSAWRLKTWDRLRIPKPFSRVTLTFHPPEVIREDLEAERVRLETILQPTDGECCGARKS